jgi:hypothetical protein
VGMRELFSTAEILIKEHGILGLALLPFCHVGYVKPENARFKGNPVFEEVVKSKADLPPGAIVTRELRAGQYLGNGHVGRNEGEDWVATVHTDDECPNCYIGVWPARGAVLKGSAGLSRAGAIDLAMRTLRGN